jgi:branched-chain amino acid transport system permease protein
MGQLITRDIIRKIKPALIALWFSLLFLPLKGVKSSLLLFGVLSILLFFFKSFLRRGKSLQEGICVVWKRIGKKRIPAFIPPIARYLAIVGLLCLPFFAENYLLDVMILAGIYAILALGLNVVVGFTGLLNLGYVAFYALGAYAYALLNVKCGLGFWQALPFCIGLTSLSGFILAVPALRLKGDYLAIVTLGFGEIVRLILNNWDSLTNGPNGISGIAAPSIFGSSLESLNRYYYLVFLSVVLTYSVVKRVRFSKIGRAWIAIREDEICAATMGINTTRYKLYAFAFGSLWAGIAGPLFAAKMRFVSPESFTFMESVLILCMVILGGLGSLTGVVLGAFVLVILPEVLRGVQSYRMLVLSIGLIVMMIFKPQGLLGGIGRERMHDVGEEQ